MREILFRRGIGFVLRWVWRPRHRVMRHNLGLAFPKRSVPERRRIQADVYRHLAETLTEILLVVKEPRRALQWMTSVEGESYLADALRSGRGVLIVTGHVGNWELLAAWLAQRGYPLHAIVRRQNDPELESVVESLRRGVGLRTLSKKEHLKRVVALLRRGAFVGILADQHAGERGVPLPLFGVQTPTAVGPAALAKVADVPVIPVFSARTGPKQHCVKIGPPLHVDGGLNKEEIYRRVMGEYNHLLEAWISGYPEQWLWLHRRWRREGRAVNVDEGAERR
ncbi:MAG: lysophospholipid acyltransferase family protein [Synergistales bacterium]|nr:lysophospholipid acyltransferase family protein [Synergistales bacterium]